MSEWPLRKLHELTSKIGSGATPRGGSSVYTQTGAAFIRSQNVLDHSMKSDDIARLSESAAHDLRGVAVESRDVLINITGDSIARCSIVDDTLLPARVNQHVAILRTSSELWPEYLQRVLVNPSYKDFLIGISSGGTRKALTKSDLGNLDIPLPPMAVQQAIAEVLGSLDDKIAANIKLASKLAEVATAQFDFASTGTFGAQALSELVSTQYGVTTSAHNEAGPKFLRVTDINKKPWIEWQDTPNCTVTDSEWEKYRTEEGDILVARMADPGKAAYIDYGDPAAVFASYLVRLKPLNMNHALYIYYFLRSDAYQRYANGVSDGSVQRNMNAKVIVNTDIALPSEATLAKFNRTVTSIRCTIQSVLQENVSLTATRDALLPQLISGKLRVKDAEAHVSAKV